MWIVSVSGYVLVWHEALVFAEVTEETGVVQVHDCMLFSSYIHIHRHPLVSQRAIERPTADNTEVNCVINILYNFFTFQPKLVCKHQSIDGPPLEGILAQTSSHRIPKEKKVSTGWGVVLWELKSSCGVCVKQYFSHPNLFQWDTWNHTDLTDLNRNIQYLWWQISVRKPTAQARAGNDVPLLANVLSFMKILILSTGNGNVWSTQIYSRDRKGRER